MKRMIFLVAVLVGAFATGESGAGESTGKFWIFFRDKGPAKLVKSAAAEREAAWRLSERAIQRRLKVRRPENLLDEADLAVYPAYLDSLARLGIRPVVVSRWLNGISAYLTADQVARISRLPFVKAVQPVRKLSVPKPVLPPPDLPQKQLAPLEHVYEYGFSQIQNELVNVPVLHDAGIIGKGVIVGMLDTGFNVADHPAFQHLQVLGEYDFVFGDSVTADEPDKDLKGAQTHGTQTLSVIAGFDPGNLIGPAFAAQFYLSKTEDIRSETPVEEDFWAAGIEWMEARGIDVASSSLGYRDFDNPQDSYGYEDMDGQTTVVTRAAQLAAERGVVVVNSAGNEGRTSWRYIIAPADGRDVIAVGAVTSAGVRAGFSSIGPTYDGRIKPDVMALGVNVYTALPAKQTPYTSASGTSFSCPMVAGIAALMLSAHPYLTPRQVIEALKMTAGQAEQPDNFMGYGIVDAKKAVTYWGPAFANEFEINFLTISRITIAIRVVSMPPIRENSAQVFWRYKGETGFRTTDMQFADSTLLKSASIPIRPDTRLEFYLSVEVEGGGRFTHPRNAPERVFELGEGGNVELPDIIPEQYEIQPVFPNPVNLTEAGLVWIQVGLPRSATVEIGIYNLLGREVVRLSEGEQREAGLFLLRWDGRSQTHRPVSSGIYIVRAIFRQDDGTQIIKHRKFTLFRGR